MRKLWILALFLPIVFCFVIFWRRDFDDAVFSLAAHPGPGTNLDLYENTVWLIIITMTTVGYGGEFLRNCRCDIEVWI